MSDQAYIVMPMQGNGGQQQQQHNPHDVAAAVQGMHANQRQGQFLDQTSQGQFQGRLSQGQSQGHTSQQDGPLKRALVNNQDSLYRYISWEDPLRTLGSYLGLLGLLFGVHYLHPTQLLLKVAAMVFGGVSLVSAASRFTQNDFVAQFRPKQYRRVPEQTLNATLHDLHDFVQYAVVEFQRVLYGEDLQGAITAFVGATSLFWLIKIISPFGLAILGLTTVYLAPLLNSPQGRAIARDASVRAQEVAGNTAETAKGLAVDSKNKAANLASQAQRTAGNLAGQAQETAGNVTNQAQNTAGNVANKTQNAAGSVVDQAKSTAYNSGLTSSSSDYTTRQRNTGTEGVSPGPSVLKSAQDISQHYDADTNFGTGQSGAHYTTSSNTGSLAQQFAGNPNVTVDKVVPRYGHDSRFDGVATTTGEEQYGSTRTGNHEQPSVLGTNVSVDGVIPQFDQGRY